MKRLWVAAALAPLMFAAAAHAQTDISNNSTTPVATATANNGSPSDIEIESGGSVDPTSGTAVTVNSNNNVTNAGTIQIQNQSNSTGILAVVPSGGLTSTIENDGSININETATPPTNSTTGIANGPFASGSGNYGINVTGAGPLIGGIINTGTITVDGDNSAGIQVGGGGIAGGISNTGTITVVGGEQNANNPAYGIHAIGGVGGPVSITGAVSATGAGAVGLALDQGAASLDINSTISATGFRSLTPPTETNLVAALTPDQLLAGGPAVSIGGSVPGGITIDAAVLSTTTVAGTTTTTTTATSGGFVSSSGPAPAILIGGPNALTIGGGSTGASLVLGGLVSSNGLYNNFNATGIQIGTGAAAANLTGGIALSGNLDVSSVATSTTAANGLGNATGIHIEPLGSVGGIDVGGSFIVSSTSTVANTVTAIQVDQGGALNSLIVNGSITAAITGISATLNGPNAAGGTLGTVTAVSDQSGTLTSVINTGTISATITPIIPGQTETGTTVALNLSANTTGVTVTQLANSNAAVTPSITGDVLFGSGNATLDLEAGTLTGAVSFGSGAGNNLILNNGAQLTGDLSVGGQIAANINNGQLTMTAPNVIALTSLHIGSAGSVVFAVDPAAGTFSQFNVAGAATLDSGAKIGLDFLTPPTGVTSFTLIQVTGNNSLTASNINQSLVGEIPYILDASVAANTGPDGSVVLTASRRTAAEADFNPAQTAAYNAIFAAFQLNPTVSADLLSKDNRSDFVHLYDQFLPDYAGGPFDSMVLGQSEIASAEADQPIKLQGDEARGWVQEIGYLDNRQADSATNGYRAGGFGIIGGLERAHGDSAVGVAASFMTDGVKDGDQDGPGATLASTALEVGVYWREGVGDGLNLHASANGGYVALSNIRLLYDQNSAGVTTLFDEAKSQWNGAVASVELGASYQVALGRVYLRPEASLDYIALYESAFSEHGGGPAMDLSVASRLNQEATAEAKMVLGMDFGTAIHWRPELTVGWRQIVAGGPGDTTAQFVSGDTSFTLTPQLQDRGGLLARLGLRAGGPFADFSADAGGEFNKDYQTYDARAVARFLF